MLFLQIDGAKAIDREPIRDAGGCFSMAGERMSARCVTRISSMHALKDLSASEMAAVQSVILDGYYEGSTRGAGAFRYLTGEQCSSLVADGGYVIAPSDHRDSTSHGCMQRQIADGYLHSDYWGAADRIDTSWGKAKNLAAFQAMIDTALRNNLNAFVDCGKYHVNGTLTISSTDSKNPIEHALQIHGCGSASAFVMESPLGAQIVDDIAPILHLTKNKKYPTYSPRLELSGINFWGNVASSAATTPVLQFDVLVQGGVVHDIDVYQLGRGNGIECSYCYLNRFEDITILGPTSMTSPPVIRFGIGLHAAVGGHAGGLTTIRRVTSRGFLWGYKIGDGDQVPNDVPLSFRCEQCEVSMDSNGWWIAPGAASTVIDNSYNDSGLDGTLVYDRGSGTIVRNMKSWGGFAVGIDGTDASVYGSIYEGNTLHMLGSGAIGIKIASNMYGKYVGANTITFSGHVNQTGVFISGESGLINGLSTNVFSPPDALKCEGCSKISDNTTGFGLTGLLVEMDAGGLPVTKLANGTLSLHYSLQLTEENIKDELLTLSNGAIYPLSCSSNCTVARFVGVTFPRIIVLSVTSGNVTLRCSESLRLAGSRNYTPGPNGATITFSVNHLGVASEISRTEY
jgi:hypothetical protein